MNNTLNCTLNYDVIHWSQKWFGHWSVYWGRQPLVVQPGSVSPGSSCSPWFICSPPHWTTELLCVCSWTIKPTSVMQKTFNLCGNIDKATAGSGASSSRDRRSTVSNYSQFYYRRDITDYRDRSGQGSHCKTIVPYWSSTQHNCGCCTADLCEEKNAQRFTAGDGVCPGQDTGAAHLAVGRRQLRSRARARPASASIRNSGRCVVPVLGHARPRTHWLPNTARTGNNIIALFISWLILLCHWFQKYRSRRLVCRC